MNCKTFILKNFLEIINYCIMSIDPREMSRVTLLNNMV